VKSVQDCILRTVGLLAPQANSDRGGLAPGDDWCADWRSAALYAIDGVFRLWFEPLS
jgi:hypothetical protein